MHDLIHSLDDLEDSLPFKFSVIAERGKHAKSKNILYAKFPFLKRYTETYTIPAASSPSSKQKEKATSEAKAASASRALGSKSDTRQINQKSNTSVTLNSEASMDNVPKDALVPENAIKLLARLILRVLRKLIRLGKRTKKKLENFVRKSIKIVTAISQLRSGTAYSLVWKWCREHAVSNTDKIGAVDIFHIVRPNAVSDRMIEKLRVRNPNMKVLMGPNLMAYGPPSNGFNFEEFADKKIDRILAISSYHSKLLNEFGFSSKKITRLPPSVNPKYFSPSPSQQNSDENRKFTIIFAASQLSVEKGALDFLNAINRLESEGNLEFQAIMIGGFKVNKGVQTPIEEEVWNSASKAITFAGKVTRADMQEYYRNADVFVHTGEPENGPTTIIEALSCGTPCILPNHECFKEPEFTTGVFYYEKGDLDQLLKYIYSISDTSKASQPTFLPETTHADTIEFISEFYKALNDEVVR